MAFVYEESFSSSADVRQNQPFLAKDIDDLLSNVNGALHKLSGPPVITSEGPLYMKVPKGLSAKIWEDTIISYYPDRYGASADYSDLEISLGYFFSKPQPRLIIEKVLLHEFIHLVLFSQKVDKPFHHGQIDRIIKLMLPGDPNPLGTVGWAC